MGKRHVDKEWPSLVLELNSHMQGSNPNNIRVALECVKKICKKYRFMFRSDALYTEMNYVILNFSQSLLQILSNANQQLAQPNLTAEAYKIFLTISNSTLHIIESILSQEELPDFYEENLPTITQCCTAILNTDFP